MKVELPAIARRIATATVACMLCGGCAGTNDGDRLDPSKSGLQGTWEYLVLNTYDARFTGCTGDAGVLEGVTLYEGMALAPICQTAVQFPVNQVGSAFDAPPHQVTCSLGAQASVSGFGQIVEPDLGGQWESVSDQGVTTTQEFTGVIVGSTIELSETRRTFVGDFQGSCDFSPPLDVVVTVQ